MGYTRLLGDDTSQSQVYVIKESYFCALQKMLTSY